MRLRDPEVTTTVSSNIHALNILFCLIYRMISNNVVCHVHVHVASYPGPSRGGGKRAWYTLHAHAPGDPRKVWGNRILSYTLRLLSIELYVVQNP